MTVAEVIAQLPDDTRVSVVIGGNGPTMAELRAAFVSSGPAYISTRQASEKFGWTPEYWADQAPEMEGAFKDQYWHLPVEGCESHVARKARNRRRIRGWKATPSPPSRPRSPALQRR